MRSLFFNTIRFLFVWILLSESIYCSKHDQTVSDSPAGIQTYNIFPGKDYTSISLSQHRILVRVPDSVFTGSSMAANFTVTPGSSLSIDGQIQESGITRNNFQQDVHYTLTGRDRHNQQNWTVQASNNDYSISWGLGHFINNYKSNDKSYDWYIDQSTSGHFASLNCGPASVTMAIKWANPDFTKTALDARMTYEASGGWWYTGDIDAYLSDNQITHAIVALTDQADSTAAVPKRQLMNDQIIILCLDMNHVRAASDTVYRTDKFYSTTPAWGHFIVLKGYKITDGELYFEAYDPYSFGLKNGDNTLKGVNRYYRYEDLAAACLQWWNYAFVIAKNGANLSLDTRNKKLNPSHVPMGHSASGTF